MDLATIQSMLTIGETVAVEFKRCGNGIESDTYETVCSFLNRFGGDIFLGVLNDGTVLGVPKNAVSDMIKNFIKVVSNPALFSPTVYLVLEKIEYDENHTIIRMHVPPSAEVHSYKKVIYDRVDDADVKVTATGAIAQMYICKQNIFTEKKIYPYAKLDDLRMDLLPKIRIMAQNHAGGTHPWTSMDGYITEDNLQPVPKNPVIASFFRNIGYADQLGSGVRNLFKYSKYYSGRLPEFMEGDIFRIIVPLDEKYSFDFGQPNQSDQSNQSNQVQLSEDEVLLLNLIKEYPDMTNLLLAEKLGWSVSRVKYYIQKLKQFEKIRRKGTSRNGRWEVL